MHVYLVNFDGVLCDGTEELIQTTWAAARERWPDLDLKPDPQLQEQLEECRPVIKYGYEMMVLLRMLRDGRAVDDILDNFGLEMMHWSNEQKGSVLRALSRSELLPFFATIRDQRLASDSQRWLTEHRVYPDVLDAIAMAESPVYVFSSRERRFVDAVLRSRGVNLPPERIVELSTGESISDLVVRLCRTSTDDVTVALLDDCVDTVLDVADRTRTRSVAASVPDVLGMPVQPYGENLEDRVELYVANWGPLTPEQRQAAREHPRVTLLQLPDFTRHLR